MGGGHEFIQNNVCLLDARTCFFSLATGITPAMSVKIVGGGSQYAVATLDADRNLDGSKTYRLHLPPNVPVKPFWSLIPYDTQTRSVLPTDQHDTALSSDSGTVKANADGSVGIYVAPKPPAGQEANWLPILARNGWVPFFRFYGPGKRLFDKTWKLPDIEKGK